MKRLLASVVVVALATPWLLIQQAQAQPADAPKSASVEQELIKLEDGWVDAFIKGDAAYVDRVVADDFTDTDHEGHVSTKAEDIAMLKSGLFKITQAKNDMYKVHVYGETAIVTYRSIVKGEIGGKDISGQYRSTDTWVERAGHWQCVATHYSKIVEEK